MTKKILIIIAPKNFRDEEYFIPKEIFLKEYFNITTASKDVTVAIGKLGGTTNINFDITKVNMENYDCLIGGSGAMIYKDNKTIQNLILEAYKQKKLISAICIAPILLAYSGILKNKKATVWNEDKEQEITLKDHGATYINQTVVIDKNIITANGPQAAEEFAKEIVKYLKNN